ncbi:hypothetical protein H072_11508 [Dactylellina haptotyla CBS 200.50]|uniref:Uncharacterized protein n=1 Tax=Dactylellina haptotyla (strain CBS 200.50) TaxID=1284197 RepID=S8BIY1_DACHA|nr:hypothetical protein H072_11508 [Dactylellina haptotyla CBS 200.50]
MSDGMPPSLLLSTPEPLITSYIYATAVAAQYTSTNSADNNIGTIIGVTFGVIGFILILCLFTCCCGACRVRSIPRSGDLEKGSGTISVSLPSSSGGCERLAPPGAGRRNLQGQATRYRTLRFEEREEERSVEGVGGPGEGVGGIRRPAYAYLHHGGGYGRRTPPRPRSPGVNMGIPGPGPGPPRPPPYLGTLPNLRFPISEVTTTSSYAGSSIGTSPRIPHAHTAGPEFLRPITPVPVPPKPPTPGRTSRPVSIHQNCVSKEALENIVDQVVDAQIADIQRVEDDLLDEQTQRQRDGIRAKMRDSDLREHIRNLKERTRNLEDESKEILFRTTTGRPHTPLPPVIIRNTCIHRSDSRRGSRGSDSGSDTDINPRGPPLGPLPVGPGGPGLRGPRGPHPLFGGMEGYGSTPPTAPLSPTSSFRPPGPPGPPGVGIGYPVNDYDHSMDDGSEESAFATASEEAPSPRTTAPPRRASIEYHPTHVPAVPPGNTRNQPRMPRRRVRPSHTLRPGSFGRGHPYQPSLDTEATGLAYARPEINDQRSYMGPRPFPQNPDAYRMRGMGEHIRRGNIPRGPPFVQHSGPNLRPHRRPSVERHMNDMNVGPEGQRRRRSMSDQPSDIGGAGLSQTRGARRPQGVDRSVHFESDEPIEEFPQFPLGGSTSQFDRRGRRNSSSGIPGEFPPHMRTSQPHVQGRRRSSGHGGMHMGVGMGSGPPDSDISTEMGPEYGFPPGGFRGTPRRTSSTIAEPPYMDGGRESYLDRMGRMGDMETIPSQGTGSETNGESGTGRDGRYHYHRYPQDY